MNDKQIKMERLTNGYEYQNTNQVPGIQLNGDRAQCLYETASGQTTEKDNGEACTTGTQTDTNRREAQTYTHSTEAHRWRCRRRQQ